MGCGAYWHVKQRKHGLTLVRASKAMSHSGKKVNAGWRVYRRRRQPLCLHVPTAKSLAYTCTYATHRFVALSARTNTARTPRTCSRSPATGGAEAPHTHTHDTQMKDRDAKLGGGHIPALFSPLVSVARTYSHTARLPPCCRIHIHLTPSYKQAGFSSGNPAHRNRLHKPHMLRFQPTPTLRETQESSLQADG